MRRSMHEERLNILADYLDDVSNFEKKMKWDYGILTNHCGTVGCAMGHLPTAFPADWEWVDDFQIRNRDKDSVAGYFELCDSASHHIFEPNCQDVAQFGGHHLPRDATAAQVASNIREMLKHD